MTGKRKLWILVILLAVLFASNWAISAWSERQEEKKEEEAEVAKRYLTDADDITAYSYSDGENEMSFTLTEAVRKLEDPDVMAEGSKLVCQVSDGIVQKLMTVDSSEEEN